MPAPATRLGSIPRVYQTHHTASLCRFAREVLDKVVPSGIQDAFCQMSVPHHVRDAEVFERDSVVARDQRVRQFIQEVLACVRDLLMLALELQHGLAPACATLFAASNAPLKDAQLPLRCPILAGMPNLFAFARGDQAGNPNIHAHIRTGCRQRDSFNLTRKAGVPTSGAARDANCFDLPFEWTMPADGDTTDARQLETPPIDLEPVPVFLEAETRKAIPALEPRKAGRLTCLDAPEEGLKCFIQVGDDDLQDVAVDAFGVGVDGLLLLHPRKLLILPNRLAALLIGISTFCKTLVIPAAAGRTHIVVAGTEMAPQSDNY